MRSGGLFLICVLACGSVLAQEDDVEGPAIEHEPVAVAVVGRDVLLVASFQDENGVFEPAVLYRVGSEGEFLSVPMEATGDDQSWTATIPGELVVANLEYFVEAFDELGNGPSRKGDPDLPLTIRVVAPSEDLGDGDGDAAGDGDGDSGDGDGDQPEVDAGDDESEGSGLGLWLGLGGAAGGAAVLAVAGAAAAGVIGYLYFTSTQTNPTLAEVNVTVTTPSPTGSALMAGGP